MKTFITADWHLGDPRQELLKRPFGSKSEAFTRTVFNHNEVVSKDDLVYVNGDCLYREAHESWLKAIGRFNGRKVLIRGNHDRSFTDNQLAPYFEKIIPEGEGIELDIHGLQCYITHYPTRGRKDRFNLIGHIHDAWKYQLNMLNVGVDVHHFAPVDLNTIPFYYKSICEFYDEDVWVAYREENAKYRGLRGKEGSYYHKE